MKKQSPLKKLRKSLGFSMEQFGEILGITGPAVFYYESGKRHPRVAIAHKILALAKLHDYQLTLEDIYPKPNSTNRQ